MSFLFKRKKNINVAEKNNNSQQIIDPAAESTANPYEDIQAQAEEETSQNESADNTAPTVFEQPPIRELSDAIPPCDNFACNWTTSDGSCGCWGAVRYGDVCCVTDCSFASICYACKKEPCRDMGLRTLCDKRPIEGDQTEKEGGENAQEAKEN